MMCTVNTSFRRADTHYSPSSAIGSQEKKTDLSANAFHTSFVSFHTTSASPNSCTSIRKGRNHSKPGQTVPESSVVRASFTWIHGTCLVPEGQVHPKLAHILRDISPRTRLMLLSSGQDQIAGMKVETLLRDDITALRSSDETKEEVSSVFLHLNGIWSPRVSSLEVPHNRYRIPLPRPLECILWALLGRLPVYPRCLSVKRPHRSTQFLDICSNADVSSFRSSLRCTR